MFGELKVRIIVRRTVRSMFGEQTFDQLRTVSHYAFFLLLFFFFLFSFCCCLLGSFVSVFFYSNQNPTQCPSSKRFGSNGLQVCKCLLTSLLLLSSHSHRLDCFDIIGLSLLKLFSSARDARVPKHGQTISSGPSDRPFDI